MGCFLRPFPDNLPFDMRWQGADLCEAPPFTVAAIRGETPAAVLGSSSEASAALCLGGALRALGTSGDGTLGLGGQLPAHGCVEAPHDVLLQISLLLDSEVGAPAWQVLARSPELRLAEATAAAVVSQLRCMPSGDEPEEGMVL